MNETISLDKDTVDTLNEVMELIAKHGSPELKAWAKRVMPLWRNMADLFMELYKE